jgi:ABC-type transport system substrate-binding protein
VWWGGVGAAFGAVGGYSGYADIRAACDDFVKSGFIVVNGANATDCGSVALASLGTTVPSSYAHLANKGNQLLFFLRSSQFRKAFGQIIADSLNFLFGTPNNGATIPNQTPPCTVLYVTLAGGNCNIPTGVMSPSPSCIFDATCSWNLYTGGWAVGTGPGLLYFAYYSSLASSVCGGLSSKTAVSLDNYGFYCDPQFDTFAFAAEFKATTIAGLVQFFARAAETGALNGMTVPGFTPTSQFVALNGWNFQQCTGTPCSPTQSSLVPTFGKGFFAGSGYWSLLNMRQVPGYTPSNPNYKPGGGNPDLIRRGWGQGTSNLNPFWGGTVWDLELISLIYESMLQANPVTGGVVDGQVVDWQTTSHSSTFNPAEVSCNTLNGCVTGTTTTLWHLRNDAVFQDGTSLTATDVVYTILSYRDVPSFNFKNSVSSVTSAVTIDPLTVQVKFQGPNPLEVLALGQLPIIPAHIWEPICGPIVNGAVPSGPTSQCANPSFDPMAQGIMIGSGPWKCVVPFGFPNAGHVGGSCITSAGSLIGQSMPTGSQVLLTRNAGYMRCCPDDPTSNLYKFSYADFNNLGRVDIIDIASVASRFGQPDPYWVNSNIAPGTTVNIEDVAIVAFYFGNGITRPFTPSQLTGLDPQIDPFFCSSTGC